ncbi:MAG: MFS transporter [Pseudomonadota bacterium]|jgi:PAT family beta-lactamase induction signal transducer AmpG
MDNGSLAHGSSAYGGARKPPPAWALGLATLVNGALSGVLTVTVPQLLAARGVPEPQIAAISGLSFLPGTFNFLVAPILDVGLSRRTYATVLALGLAALTALSLNLLGDLTMLAVTMVCANVCYYLYTPAVAGWFGQLVKREDEPTLGAWMSAASVAGFGGMSALAILVLRGLPYEVGIGVVCVASLAPLALFFFAPHEPTPTLSFRESFGPVTRNVARLVRDKHIWRMMALFAVPCASFSLTNTLSGVGTHDFHASEAFVGLIGGVGTTVGGVFGALIAPVLAKRFPPLALYIAIGVFGALFTLCLLIPARTPLLFGVAMVGENVFQAAGLAVTYALILLSIGKHNPIASTQFALINAAWVAPIVYMPMLDGIGYARGGIVGNLAVDAGLGLLASAVMALLFAKPWRATLRAEAVDAPEPT